MNDDLQLLENIANFLKQGYLIKDVFKFMSDNPSN